MGDLGSISNANELNSLVNTYYLLFKPCLSLVEAKHHFCKFSAFSCLGTFSKVRMICIYHSTKLGNIEPEKIMKKKILIYNIDVGGTYFKLLA
jgi:hypothetical protein